MPDDDRQVLFNRWAKRYDRDVSLGSGEFPFAGYDRVLDEVAIQSQARPAMSVLDIGTGTGNLAARFVALGCQVWGTDFSAEMLVEAQTKLPEAYFIQADLHGEWPTGLKYRYDRIVSAYVLHEFPLEEKTSLIARLAEAHLNPYGKIIIADIAFETAANRSQAHRRWQVLWDEDEYYWCADESLAALEGAGLAASYRQVSSCGGVFVIQAAS